MDKRFIIADEYINFEEKIKEFILNTFGEIAIRNIDVEVDFGTYEYDSGILVDELRLGIVFNQYKYLDNLKNEHTESLMLVFEYKGSQPFYINGKFVVLEVYEYSAGYPIQKNNKIYGINKDVIYERFEDFMMTC